MMRFLLINLASILMLASLQAQRDDRSYLGLKAGANISSITSANEFANGGGLNSKPGFAGGLFYHIPLGGAFSLQPEFLFSEMGATFKDNTTSSLNTKGTLNLNYFSVPLLVKISPFKRLGFFLGSQFDLFIDGKIKYDRSSMDNISLETSSTSNDLDVAGTIGAELRLSKNLGLYGRYIQGFSNIARGNIGTHFREGDDLKNNAIQVGLSLAFPVKLQAPDAALIPELPVFVDTDKDGIADPDDSCPLTFGFVKYKGCPIPDTDDDTVNDEEDKCPNEAGKPRNMGCPVPDTDGDGLNDEQDLCPTVAGIPELKGCPVADTDGDGTYDHKDNCPNQKGLDRYHGCPIPDTDIDGVNDELDKCPATRGSVTNSGCPEMIIYFNNNEPTLSADDKLLLEAIAGLLIQHSGITTTVGGHSSTLGNTAHNKTLSEKRARFVADFLISKGIDAKRLSIAGYGEDYPVENKDPEESYRLSRRVEIKVVQ